MARLIYTKLNPESNQNLFLSIIWPFYRRFCHLVSKLQAQKNWSLIQNYIQEYKTHNMIFFLGPPRCGSTLIYQAILHRLKFSYLTNSMMMFPYSVAFYTSMHIPSSHTYSSDFSNIHGQTFGENAPHEGYYFWRRFYPRRIHDYIENHELSATQVNEIIGTVSFLSDYFNAPFMSKNLEMSLRLRSIQQVFPSAIFIIIKRDPRSISSSIRKARISRLGNENRWWSMRPREYSSLRDMPCHIQIANQVALVYHYIYHDLDTLDRVMEISYEDFCCNPEKAILDLKKRLHSLEVHVLDNQRSLPRYFSIKKEFEFSRNELNEMHTVFIRNNLFDHVQYRL